MRSGHFFVMIWSMMSALSIDCISFGSPQFFQFSRMISSELIRLNRPLLRMSATGWVLIP